MAKSRIVCDKTELVVTATINNQMQNLNIPAEKIRRIQFDKCQEKISLFKKGDSEKITIETTSIAEPITFYKMKEKEHFESYKEQLEKFAKENRISFVDNTK
jgi:hypothetical protein